MALIFRRVGIAHMAYFSAIRCRVQGVVNANENRYKTLKIASCLEKPVLGGNLT